jgi:hypothetical protein
MALRIYLVLIAFCYLTFSLGCQKTYVVPPLTQSTAPTPTPVCYGGYLGSPLGACTSGIWGQAYAWNYDVNGVYQYAASMALAVNCAPETTDGVTLTGPGVTLPLAYDNLVTIGGTVYAAYQSVTVTDSLTPGDVYTMTSVTSIGTASSTVTLSAPITMTNISTGVDVVSFNNPSCGLNLFGVNSTGICSGTDPGFAANSPITISSNGICPGNYLVGAQFFSVDSTLVGGTGFFSIANGALVTWP